eukprot:38740-Eustigmatos_ZCMA.PRE.1
MLSCACRGPSPRSGRKVTHAAIHVHILGVFAFVHHADGVEVNEVAQLGAAPPPVVIEPLYRDHHQIIAAAA